MQQLLKILLYFFVLFNCACTENTQHDDVPRVKTPLGGIKGFYKISYKGQRYEAYEGIPYAVPPIGKLRFKAPQKIPAWTGEMSATAKGHECLQYQLIPRDVDEQVTGSEDCLYLNVYVPNGTNALRKQALPVLFYIHGGAFQYGSGTRYGPKYLMDKDVILVTVNYRLGPFGFLSTEDETVPGNMGLKDQSMALRWVSENIEWFGGDAKKVTLIGLSAGGVSVHYHYLSPMSANLFQNGISLSGSTLNNWAQTENALEKSQKLATILGCPTISNREMVRCMRYRPGRAIAFATKEFMPWLFNPFTPFGPVVEKNTDGAFINKPPIEIIKNGQIYDVPWLTGVTTEEGCYNAAEFAANNELLQDLNEKWENLAPFLLDYNYTLATNKKAEAAKMIKKHYLGNKEIGKTSVKEIVQMVGDRIFVVDNAKAAKMQANVAESPVWFYVYSYRATHSLSDVLSGTRENFGVSHGDDLYLVMENKVFDPTVSSEDLEMQNILMDLWVSFATNNNIELKNVEWGNLDTSGKGLNYLKISGPHKYKMEVNTNLGKSKFWNSMKFKENVVLTNINKEEL